MIGQFLLGEDRHLGVKGREHVIGNLHDCHLEPRVFQTLRHLQADKAAADHRGALRLRARKRPLDPIEIGDISKGKYGGVRGKALDIQPNRLRPRREHENVVGDFFFLARLRFGANLFFFRYDAHHLFFGAHVDAEAIANRLFRDHDQILPLGNFFGNMIGQSAVGEGHIGILVDDDNLVVEIQPPIARGKTHAAGDAAHHNYGLFLRIRLHRYASFVALPYKRLYLYYTPKAVQIKAEDIFY